MTRRLTPGAWGAMVVVAVGLVFFIYALSYPYESEIGPGPGFLPRWLSGLLVFLGILYFLNAVRGRDSSDSMPDRPGLRNIAFILACMIAYVALLPLLGFITTSALFLFALLFRAYRPVLNLVISAATSISLYLLFAVFLGVQLPLNFLGF